MLRVTATGKPALSATRSPRVASEPVSIAINRFGLVYVANVGAGGSNYAGFFLNPLGRLIPLPAPHRCRPGGLRRRRRLLQLHRRPARRHPRQHVADRQLHRPPDGRLVAAPGSPFPAQSLGPIGAEFRPTNPSQLYVSNAHAGAGLGTVSAFHVSRRGILTLDRGLPVPERPDRAVLGRDQS